MKNILFLPALAICSLFHNSCIIATAIAQSETLSGKSLDPAIETNAKQPDSWYEYLPEYAPGLCLKTTKTITWVDPDVYVGYWKGYAISEPDTVVMEARGYTFILYPGYQWDGNSMGNTKPGHLLPSLRHDALYHALKEKAQELDREAIDKAYQADCQEHNVPLDAFSYNLIRLFGGSFNEAGMHGTLTVVPTPKAPKKQDTPKPPAKTICIE